VSIYFHNHIETHTHEAWPFCKDCNSFVDMQLQNYISGATWYLEQGIDKDSDCVNIENIGDCFQNECFSSEQWNMVT
jgi:hypothetical protein